MTPSDPDSMNAIISKVLRYGVVLSSAVIALGVVLLVAHDGFSQVAAFLSYNPSQIPHGSFPVSFDGLAASLAKGSPIAVIELGVLVLLATPVSRVLFSIFLFAAEHNRTYVYITLTVFILLLFSMLVTPYIPIFGG
ncbi:MAG: DUF1634 domain-containing protein [Nitrososphaerota archaeon]|jgi:uncharacterized membrane protein|nr:DUF1634 domain-containing protein [Nitrososphaerota archaeon]MCL5672073.1 DUF1634 domain-containing protein [Nitrososphaerota archaeon]MDG6903648.1 DUF1634 domain-containing protein [Nitrososphaerota archaeon]MDG6911945.1 DUF1634 domain-containing protein [Nitrososphaerota archaeon]MDG6924497.1 DUF1634 domain-containing protein [Nitrososphaerota archaeon]